jgi:hypothetical protein
LQAVEHAQETLFALVAGGEGEGGVLGMWMEAVVSGPRCSLAGFALKWLEDFRQLAAAEAHDTAEEEREEKEEKEETKKAETVCVASPAQNTPKKKKKKGKGGKGRGASATPTSLDNIPPTPATPPLTPATTTATTSVTPTTVPPAGQETKQPRRTLHGWLQGDDQWQSFLPILERHVALQATPILETEHASEGDNAEEVDMTFDLD